MPRLSVHDLCGTWRFRPGEGADEVPITVPGFWEALGHLTLDGAASYERDIELEAAAAYATLEFDAVADLCEVFVNGERVGSHEVGFTPFALDAGGLLRAGRNTVRVEVVDPALGSPLHLETVQGKQGWGNAVFPSPPSVYLTYGGIWQPCRLVEHAALYVQDLWCDLDPDEPAVGVEVRDLTGEGGEVEIAAFGEVRRAELSGGSAVVRFRAGRADGWSPEVPRLHEIRAVACARGEASHERAIRVGLRRLSRVGDDLEIAGRPYRMRAALHQGFWPGGLYAADPDLVERDIELAREAGLNTLRTHLKAFEPSWLDAADRLGMLLHCDTPVGEPIADDAVSPDSDFGRRCLAAVGEQVRRDRSRPSIVMWTLMNEVGIRRPELLATDGYRALVRAMHDEVRRLDPSRPIVENDWVWSRDDLVVSDVRTAHWYGRATSRFARVLDSDLERAGREDGALYVTELGEWGLPEPDDAAEPAFWDNTTEVAALVEQAGWPDGYAKFAVQSQAHQGWANRIQADRLRSSPAVQGFCVTEWTDVPHELNGLVSLRRTAKQAAIEGLRPALSDIGLIALVDRYTFVSGETAEVRVFVSNWSPADLEPGTLTVRLAASQAKIEIPPVPAGYAWPAGRCRLRVPAAAGSCELIVRFAGAESRLPMTVAAEPEPRGVEVGGGDLPEGLAEAGWTLDPNGPLVVLEEAPQAQDALRDAEQGRPVVLLAQRDPVPGLWELQPVPQRWGPTPFVFTDRPFGPLPGPAVLGHEVFACAPRSCFAGVRGPVGVVVPPPLGCHGAVVAARGSLVACQLSLQEGLVSGCGFERALLAEMLELASRSVTPSDSMNA